MGELEHDLSTVTGFYWYDQRHSDVSEFTQFLNADNHLSSNKFGNNWVFWTLETYQEPPSIHEKIKVSLREVARYCDLVQFWAPKVVGNLSYLTTSEQPFAVSYLYKGMSYYREHCLNHKYIVEDDVVGVIEEQLGAVGRVFLYGYPECSPDLRLYSTKELPFRDLAARCGAKGYLVLPVFDLLTRERYGVLELLSFDSIRLSDSLFDVLRALEEADLRSTHLYMTMLPNNFREPATSEIKKMLQAAVEAVPQLHMAQAWVRCKQCAYNTNTDLYCLERAAFVTAATKKVCDYNCLDHEMFSYYLRACQWNLQGMIAIMAVSSKIKPWFSRNLCDFSICENPLAHFAQRARLSFYFAICLESGDDLCFVEFFLQPESRQDPFGASFWHLLFGVMETELKSYKVRSSDQQELVIEIHKDMLSGSTELIEHKMSTLMHGIPEHAQGRNHQFSKESNVLTVMNDYWKEYSSELDFLNHFQMNVHYSCLKYGINGKHTYLFWCQQRVNYSSFISTQDKIKWLLDKLLSEFNMTSYSLIQFWDLKMNELDGRHCLETSSQIFVVSGLHEGLGFFRNRCMEYHYFVDKGAKEEELGPPGRVFKSGHPEVTHDIRLYSTTEFPLKDDAVFCHLRTYLAFPVFDQMLKCVGVLEFVGFGNVIGDNNLIRIQKAVKEQHLRLGRCNLEPSFIASVALIEIEEALRLVFQIPQLYQLEAWVPHNNCSSTRNSLKCMERLQVPPGWSRTGPFDLVETGKGIVGTVLISENKCCYCRNSGFITEQSRPHRAQQKMLDVCFAICLQSSHTGDLPYILQFFLNQGPANYEYLWSFLYFLLPILKQNLKSFKVATGKQLGEELVVDIIEFSQVNQPTSIQFGKPNTFPVKCQIVQYGQNEHQQPIDEQVSFVPHDEVDHVPSVVAGGEQPTSIQYGQNEHQQPIDEHVNFLPHDDVDHVTSVVTWGGQCSTASGSSKNDDKSRKRKRGKEKGSYPFSREEIEGQFGNSRERGAKNLGYSESHVYRAMKHYKLKWPTKLQRIKNSQAENANNHDRDTRPSTSSSSVPPPQTNIRSTQTLTPVPEHDLVIIKAEHGVNIVKFRFCRSSGMVKLVEEVATRLKLRIESFELKYVDEENEEILLTCDEDFQLCVDNLTAAGNNCIRLFVRLISS